MPLLPALSSESNYLRSEQSHLQRWRQPPSLEVTLPLAFIEEAAKACEEVARVSYLILLPPSKQSDWKMTVPDHSARSRGRI